MRDVLDCVNDADAVHLRGQIEKALKQSLEQLAAGRDEALSAFRRKLQPIRKALEKKSFLGGAAPTYADYILLAFYSGRASPRRRRCLNPLTRSPHGSSACLICMVASVAMNYHAPSG